VNERTTPADHRAPALKRGPSALDSCRAMHTHELRLRIQRADYIVDPVAVAEAMFRHALSQRRWWNPTAVCAIPPADSMTSARPATTDPIQVSGAASSAAARSSVAKQAHSS
jgi:hypothetical protein